MFVPDHPIEGLHPASYNPRRITPDALESLQKSITAVGFAKPIICMPDGLIIAGHQRTKAATSLNINTVPAYILQDVKEADQIRFNQLHNGTDMDDIDQPVYVNPSPTAGYEMVEPENIDGNMRSKGANIRAQMCKLIGLYGPWGASVATHSGLVVASPHYALCCKILNIPCRVYRVDDDKADIARGWMTKQYGEFSYDHLPRNTYLQTFAQPMRLRGDSTTPGGNGQSLLYIDVALPHIKKTDRILDFGCGQADYVKFLKKLGYHIWGIEFFHRKGNRIDRSKVHKMIDEALYEFQRRGPFDVIVCDSVVNSVDTKQAEDDILTCLNAFAKPGARIFYSGRTREGVIGGFDATKAACKKTTPRGVEFLDEDGTSGFFRKGAWFFQKFHNREQAVAMGNFFGDFPVYSNIRSNEKSWQCKCLKKLQLPDEQVQGSLAREFNLSWPDGQTVGKDREALAAWEAVKKRFNLYSAQALPANS